MRREQFADRIADDRFAGALRAAEHERRAEAMRRPLEHLREPPHHPVEKSLITAADILGDVLDKARASLRAARIRLHREAAPEVVIRRRRRTARIEDNPG